MSLEQDYTTVPGQLYACLSVVGPEAPQKNDKFGIKIRGAFSSRDEAANHAKRLQKEDSTFDIYVVDMYKWLLIPPDPAKIEDVHYTNEKLEEIMIGYKDNQAEATRMFNDRKRDMMETKSFLKPGDENSKFYTKPDEAASQSIQLISLSVSRRRSLMLIWRISSRRLMRLLLQR